MNDPVPGSRLGKYIVRRRLGRGGMGVVFEALDPVLQRAVAIKLLPEHLRSEQNLVKRFLREAQAAAKLNHPNIVTVHEIDEHDGVLFLVMELVAGGCVTTRLNETGPLPWVDAARYMIDACKGLDAAHRAGILHRDLKPSNLLLTGDGVLKIADFGLATMMSVSSSISQGRKIVGTPHFMSPEQAQAEELDERTDLYSLGATFFSLLTNQPPYPGDDPYPVMYAHCSKPTPDPRQQRPDLPEACVAIVLKAMAKRRAVRYQNAGEMRADLEALLVGQSPGASLIGATQTTRAPVAVHAAAIDGPLTPVSASTVDEVGTKVGRRRRRGLAIGLCAVALIGLAAWFTAWPPREAAPVDATEQVNRLRVELVAKNPHFDGQFESRSDATGIRFLKLPVEHVTDLSPLSRLHYLSDLELLGPRPTPAEYIRGPLKDLTPLHGLPLKRLLIHFSRIEDLTPLSGMPLVELDVSQTTVKDLKPLAGIKTLKDLRISDTAVSTFEDLRGLQLEALHAGLYAVEDLAPLEGMPLRYFSLNAHRITNLSALSKAPLKTLILVGARNLADVSAVAQPTLQVLSIDPQGPAIDAKALAPCPLRELYAHIRPDQEQWILDHFRELQILNSKSVSGRKLP